MSTNYVIAVHSRLAHSGHEEELSHWAERFHDAVRGRDGHRGSVRLDQTEGMIHLVNCFASPDDLKAWQESPERTRLIEEADRISTGRDQEAADTRPCVKLPSEAVAPKWKTFVATWAAVFPVLLVLNGLLQLAAPGLPQAVKLIFSSLALTALLTWVILPQVRRLLRPWLLGNDGGELRTPD